MAAVVCRDGGAGIVVVVGLVHAVAVAVGPVGEVAVYLEVSMITPWILNLESKSGPWWRSYAGPWALSQSGPWAYPGRWMRSLSGGWEESQSSSVERRPV